MIAPQWLFAFRAWLPSKVDRGWIEMLHQSRLWHGKQQQDLLQTRQRNRFPKSAQIVQLEILTWRWDQALAEAKKPRLSTLCQANSKELFIVFAGSIFFWLLFAVSRLYTEQETSFQALWACHCCLRAPWLRRSTAKRMARLSLATMCSCHRYSDDTLNYPWKSWTIRWREYSFRLYTRCACRQSIDIRKFVRCRHRFSLADDFSPPQPEHWSLSDTVCPRYVSERLGTWGTQARPAYQRRPPGLIPTSLHRWTCAILAAM